MVEHGNQTSGLLKSNTLRAEAVQLCQVTVISELSLLVGITQQITLRTYVCITHMHHDYALPWHLRQKTSCSSLVSVADRYEAVVVDMTQMTPRRPAMCTTRVRGARPFMDD